MIEERVQRGANGAAGVEHIVDQHDIARVHIKADGARQHYRAYVVRGEIVAVEADVQHAAVNRMLLDVRDHPGETLCQGRPSAFNADKAEAVRSGVFLHDFVCQPDEGAIDLRG